MLLFERRIVFMTLFALGNACTSVSPKQVTDSGLSALSTDCSLQDIAGEPQWIVLRCAIENTSAATQTVTLAPVIEENDRYFKLPSQAETKSLEERLKARQGIAPVAGTIGQSPGAEGFILQLIGLLTTVTIRTLEGSAKTTQKQDASLPAGSREVFFFPLLKASQERPREVDLQFSAPESGHQKIPLEDNDSSVRKRSGN